MPATWVVEGVIGNFHSDRQRPFLQKKIADKQFNTCIQMFQHALDLQNYEYFTGKGCCLGIPVLANQEIMKIHLKINKSVHVEARPYMQEQWKGACSETSPACKKSPIEPF